MTEVVTSRGVIDGQVKFAIPMQTVGWSDDGEYAGIVVPGTQFMGVPTTPETFYDTLAAVHLGGQWTLEARTWRHTCALHRVRRGRSYNHVQFYDANFDEFICWYVNFERPVVWSDDRTSFDTLDYMIDLVVLPDGTPQWKDEDHWAWAIEHGAFPSEEIAAVEAARAAVLAEIAAGRPPFDDASVAWRPARRYEPVRLPDGWDVSLTRRSP